MLIIESLPKETTLWIVGAGTALALGNRIKRYKYILHILELYGTLHRYKYFFKDYVQSAYRIVVPESTRGAIFRFWYGLKKNPYTLPNKAKYHPRKRKMTIKDTYGKKLIEPLIKKNKKIVLYQGVISQKRDLEPIALAVSEMGSEWSFVVMGRKLDNYYEKFFKRFPEIIHIPFIQPPLHLEITSHAHIGVIVYNFDSLNNLFCAPNKIWELAGFGIPVLCNNVPALKSLIKVGRCGRSIEMSLNNSSVISAALNHIHKNYNQYSMNSNKFYESVNLQKIIKDIVNEEQ
jgi:hypothetical protein